MHAVFKHFSISIFSVSYLFILLELLIISGTALEVGHGTSKHAFGHMIKTITTTVFLEYFTHKQNCQFK